MDRYGRNLMCYGQSISYEERRFRELPRDRQSTLAQFWSKAKLEDFPKMTLAEAVAKAKETGCVFNPSQVMARRLRDNSPTREYCLTDFHAIMQGDGGRVVSVSYSMENPTLTVDDLTGVSKWVTIPAEVVILDGCNYDLRCSVDRHGNPAELGEIK